MELAKVTMSKDQKRFEQKRNQDRSNLAASSVVSVAQVSEKLGAMTTAANDPEMGSVKNRSSRPRSFLTAVYGKSGDNWK